MHGKPSQHVDGVPDVEAPLSDDLRPPLLPWSRAWSSMGLTRFTVAKPDRDEQGKALGGFSPKHALATTSMTTSDSP